MTKVLLIGNPNCGKTTLFNALTGDNQRVGNWPGVTVEKKTGGFQANSHTVEVIDLPGVYSLVTTQTGSSQDERIAAQEILKSDADLIINVVNACHLERHLYLTSQLLELGKPILVVLNMMDLARQCGITINSELLANKLQCSVIEMQAHQAIGIEDLKKAILQKPKAPPALSLTLPANLSKACEEFSLQLKPTQQGLSTYAALRILEGDDLLFSSSPKLEIPDSDILLADARYQAIHDLVLLVQKKQSDVSEHWTAKIDRFVLHRFWALPIFLAVMYSMFLFAINIGGAFQDFFDISTDAIFVKGCQWLMQQWHTPAWLIAICADGIGKGINTTLTFVPVIGAMFFFLSLLEASGYMARAAFVVDKIMRVLGLPGKSFVPMIVGFGCNVPAIMAARSLDCERDRLLTVLMSPFMSCSARLAIYAVFVAAFFPTGGQNIVFSLYLVGILMAVFTGFILRKTLLKGQAAQLILELPAYQIPTLRRLWKDTFWRLKHFITRAGKVIIPVCIVLGALNALTITGTIHGEEASNASVLSYLGQWLTPIFYPMGIQQDNWPATVGLLTGMLAKEVVVGSLNTLYSQLGETAQNLSMTFDFWGAIKTALWSIPQNFSELGGALINPILASAPDGKLSQSVYGVMSKYFDGKAGAYAYLLFILLYIPCVSTMAVIRQEANYRFMIFSVVWSLLVAYTVAVLYYQFATFQTHPVTSLLWVGVFIGIYCFTYLIFKRIKLSPGENHASTSA